VADVTRHTIRTLLESECGGDTFKFEASMRHMLGLCDKRGRVYRDAAGNRELRDPTDETGRTIPRLKPDQIPLRALNESLLGANPEKAVQAVGHVQRIREIMEAERSVRAAQAGLSESEFNLLEDTGAGAMMPSGFADINAWTGVSVGLMEVGILEAYKNPEYIADQIAPVSPSRIIEGRKTIGAARVGDQAEERLPGMPTKRVQFGERWLTQPRTVENALAAELLWETVFLDITGGQISQHANDIGDWLAWHKDLRCIRSFVGTGQVSAAEGYGVYVFTYKGTNYNPYASGGVLYTNDLSGNQLLYRGNIQTAEIAFRDMLDPETGTRVLITPNTMLVNRETKYIAEDLFSADKVEFRQGPGATTGDQATRWGKNQLQGKYQVIESPLYYQVCTDANGLALSATAAGQQWFLFERGSNTHVYIQNQPLTTVTVAGNNQVDMVDRNVVLFVKAWERGIPMWIDPRRCVRSRQ
jgi:hypothetical protein